MGRGSSSVKPSKATALNGRITRSPSASVAPMRYADGPARNSRRFIGGIRHPLQREHRGHPEYSRGGAPLHKRSPWRLARCFKGVIAMLKCKESVTAALLVAAISQAAPAAAARHDRTLVAVMTNDENANAVKVYDAQSGS